MINKYIKKPVVVEAVQWTGYNLDEIRAFCPSAIFVADQAVKDIDVCPLLQIPTLEGIHYAILKDYIIKGVDGEFYPCKESIFLKTYEEISNNEAI